MTDKNPAEDIPCPECTLKGRTRMLQLYQINFNEAIYWCGMKDCTYPKGHKTMIINRNIMDTCSDTESGSTDSDIEKITQMFTDRARKKVKRASKVKSSSSVDIMSDSDSDSDSADDIEKAFDILKGKKYINVNKNNIFVKCNKKAGSNTLLDKSVSGITKDLRTNFIVNVTDNNTVPIILPPVENCIILEQNKSNNISNLLNDNTNNISNLLNDATHDAQSEKKVEKDRICNLNMSLDKIRQENVLENSDLMSSITKFKSNTSVETSNVNGSENICQNSSIICNDKGIDINIMEKVSENVDLSPKPIEIQNLPNESNNMDSIFDPIKIETGTQSKINSNQFKISDLDSDITNMPKQSISCKSTSSIFDPCDMETNLLSNVDENHSILPKFNSYMVKDSDISNLHENILPNLTSTPVKISTKNEMSTFLKENGSESSNLTSGIYKPENKNNDVLNGINLDQNGPQNLIFAPLEFEKNKNMNGNAKENVSECNQIPTPLKIKIMNGKVSNGDNLLENISQNLTSTPLKHKTKKDISNNENENVSKSNHLTSIPLKIEIKGSDTQNDITLQENISDKLTFSENKNDLSNNVLETKKLPSVPFQIEIKIGDTPNNGNLNSAPFKIQIKRDEKVNIPIQNIQNCFKNNDHFETKLNSNINILECPKSQQINDNISLIPASIKVFNDEINVPNETTANSNNVCTNLNFNEMSNVNSVSNNSLNDFDLPDITDLENVDDKSMLNNSLELNLDDKMNLTDMINNADNLDIDNMPIIFGDFEENDKLFDTSLKESEKSSNLIKSSKNNILSNSDQTLTNVSSVKIETNRNDLNNINSDSKKILRLNSENLAESSQNGTDNDQKNNFKVSKITNNIKTVPKRLVKQSFRPPDILSRIKLPADASDKVQKTNMYRMKGSSLKIIGEKYGIIDSKVNQNTTPTKITEQQMLAMKKLQNIPGVKKVCFIKNKDDIPLKNNPINLPISPDKNKKELSTSLISAALAASLNSMKNKTLSNTNRRQINKPKTRVSKAGPSRFQGFNFDEPTEPVSTKQNVAPVSTKSNVAPVSTKPNVAPVQSSRNVPVIEAQKPVSASQVTNDMLDLDIDKVNIDLGTNVTNSNMDVSEMDKWLSSLLD